MTRQTVAILGFGRTGKAVLDFFLERNSNRVLYLFNDMPIGDTKSQRRYEEMGVTFLVGEEHFHRLEEAELIILSPGIDGAAPRFAPLREKRIKIVSEIELAFAFIDARIIAVTGTNGKSTTVSLIHHILKTGGIQSFLAGNIGQPLIAEVGKMPAGSVVVVEVSSFQLEEIEYFRPDIAVILNITPDHLDRYDRIEDYFDAKLNLVRNQARGDWLILNRDDPVLRREEHKERYGTATPLWFSRRRTTPGGLGTPDSQDSPDVAACFEDDGHTLRLSLGDPKTVETLSLHDNPLRGIHNLENILAAAMTARLAGAEPGDIRAGIAGFTGLPHRMESAGKLGGVEFINDSKATNVDAALMSIKSINEPMALILGGRDKGGDFSLLLPEIRKKVDNILLIGEAADTIRKQLILLSNRFYEVTDLADAIEKGWKMMEPTGGIVLLAPACTSFDMFDNFEQRGDVFKEEVAKLIEKEAKGNG
ncbi:MAG: UDP-N-acetylmuramoyl-L-alanine--D-glutamate ligase [bacterium]|nr:UDP-N-acetylmuramoyl-L-alanine--D-glutamate ligase [bacterium]